MQYIGKILFLLLIGIFTGLYSFCQKQNNQWRFGANGAVDFNTVPPSSPSDCIIQTYEGSASVADKNTGALLFYTDGVIVWDANNNIMPNGTGLRGGATLSSSTAAVIVPRPFTPNIYYIITIDEQSSNGGVRYSVVDMTLNGGLGGIVAGQKNIFLFATTSEKLHVVPTADRCGYWLLTHDNPGNTFYAFKITQAGINTAPVTSSAGVTQGSGAGHMKINRQFNKLAIGSFFGFKIELFDFDNTTGVVSNPVEWNYTLPNGNVFYGIEFSPDGTKLYVSNLQRVVQYDITQTTPALIEASLYNVTPGFNALNQPASLQLGPDNKIYIASTPFSVINFPDNAGIACGFQEDVLTLSNSGQAQYGLPQWIYDLEKIDSANRIIYQDTCLTNNTLFSIQNTAAAVSVIWNFGDPASGGANTSNSFTPSHVFSQVGQFSVRAIITYTCFKDTIDQVINIRDCTVPTITGIKIAGDTCDAAAAITFQVVGTSSAPSFSWNFGDPVSGANNTVTITGGSPDPNPSHVFSAPGTYNVCVTFTEPGFGVAQVCREVSIGLCPPCVATTPAISGPTSLCAGDSIILTSSAASAYLWSTGATTQSIQVKTGGIYSVTITDALTCTATASVTITQNTATTNITGNLSFCTGSNTVLTANAGSSYVWSTGAATQSITVNSAGDYTVTVTQPNGCSAAATVSVVNSSPVVSPVYHD